MKIYIFQVLSSNTNLRAFMYFFRLSLFLLLFLQLSLHAKDASLEKVTLQLQWKHQFEFAGFYAAKEKGFYRDVGLDVTFVEFDGNKNITDEVLNGNAQYGLAYSSIITEYLKGKPFILLANFFKQSPLVLIAQPNIKTPADLKGKKIMGLSDSIDNITLLTMLNKFNIHHEDFENIAASFNINDFANKKVDAMSVFTTNELYELDKKGIKYNIFDPVSYGAKYYDLNLFTTQKEVSEHPQRGKHFKEASIKGWEYALSHQDEIIELILKKYNTQNKTKEALAFEAKQIEQIMLPNIYPIGSIDMFRIRIMADSFIQSRFVENVKESKNRDLNRFIFQDKDNPLNFTKQEQEFIKNNPIIRVSNENDWQPFDFAENGKAKGYSVDIVKNLAKKIGVKIEFVNGYTWSELLKLFNDGKIDMLHVVRKNKSRIKKYNYSEPYITWYGAYFTRKDEEKIKSVKDFDNKKIGLVKGWGTTYIFKEKFPKAFAVEYKNISDLLTALSLKEVDAIISMISTARYTMMQELITNVKLGGYVNINDFIIDNKLYFASQKDKPEIISIFNKALSLLTAQEKNVLYDKWFGVKKGKIKLTPKELTFINNHPKIILGTEKTWKPYVIIKKDGTVSGYDADVLKLINEVSGSNFVLKAGNWAEMQTKAKAKEIDGLSTGGIHDERKTYLNFSDIYISMRKMLIVSKDNPKNIQTLDDLDGKTIAIHKSNLVDEKAARKFSNSKIVRLDTIEEVITSVSTGKADAMLGNGATFYLANELGLPYLKRAARLDEALDLAFGIRKDWSEAISIINKSLAHIGEHKLLELKNKWFWQDKATFLDKNYQNLKLTEDEKQYLKNKKELKMCVDPDWMPFEKIENGKHIGVSADYIKLLKEKIGTSITLTPTTSWSDSILFIKERKCDIVPLAMETPKRKKFMNFTKPYLTVPLVITTTNDKFFIANIKELEGKTIGIEKSYAQAELLKIKYPMVNFVEVNTITEGLEKVINGNFFGYIDNLTTIGYQIQKYFPTQLKITGQFDEQLVMGIGVRKDEPLLLSILDKALNTIDSNRREHILNQWISVKYELGYDKALFWKILTPFFILALLLLISQYILRQYNKKLKNEVAQNIEELRKKDKMLLKKHRMAEMGEMLSMIAHQWRQPLGTISSAVMGIEVKLASGKFNLEDRNDREKFLNYLKKKHHKINEYVQYLSTTTDDFRNFFNPNKMKDHLQLTPPIESALQIVQKTMETNGVEIIKDFKMDTKIELYQNEVMQVILSLLKNSEDNFLEKNISHPQITITTYRHNANYIISICDNGEGISEDIIDKIFDPYFSTKDEKNGAGLGLYMSKLIIEDHHNGILNVKNTEEGVCFEIIFKEQIMT